MYLWPSISNGSAFNSGVENYYDFQQASSPSTFTLFATRPLGHCETNEYNLFYQKLDAEHFFIRHYFSKIAVFSEKNSEKPLRGAFDNFLGKRCVFHPKINITFLLQMRYRVFYYSPIFSKKDLFSEKTLENPSLGPLVTKMNTPFYMGNEVSNIFSFINFFEKKPNFWRKRGKKFWGDMTIF